MTHWMFNCQEVSRLVSISMDQELGLSKRLGLRLHLMMCRYCARNRRQLYFLRELMRSYQRRCDDQADDASLPPEARQRMKQKLGAGPDNTK